MKNKSLIVSLFAVLLLTSFASIALAQEETSEDIVIPANETAKLNPDAGFSYGLGRAIENIGMLLTFGKSAKAEKGLQNAYQRLLEVREMIQEKRFAIAEKIANESAADIEAIKARVKSLEDKPEKQLELELKIQDKIEKHQENIEKLEAEIEAMKDNLTEQEQEKVDAIVENMKNKTAELKSAAKEKIASTKTKLKAEKELTDDEVEEIVKEKESELNITALQEKRAERAIKRLEWIIGKTETRIAKAQEKGFNITALESRLATATDLIAKAQELKDAGQLDEFDIVIGEAKEAGIMKLGKPFDEKGRERAAAVIGVAIEKLRARMAEGENRNLSEAISVLTRVQEKLQEAAKENLSKAEEQIREVVRERVKEQAGKQTESEE